MTVFNVSLRSQERSNLIRNLLRDPEQVNSVDKSSRPTDTRSTVNQPESLPYIVNKIVNYKVTNTG